ncbi:cupin domain-containing protein [Cupriavidus basilensis]
MGQNMFEAGAPAGARAQRREGTFASSRTLALQNCPIEPSWIRTGAPRTHAAQHSGAIDGLASTNIWECTTGTFEWYYGWEETVFILAGQVKVTSPGGQVHVLKAGDIGYFPADTTWLWEVDGYVRKIAFCRKHVPLVLNVPCGCLHGWGSAAACARDAPRHATHCAGWPGASGCATPPP